VETTSHNSTSNVRKVVAAAIGGVIATMAIVAMISGGVSDVSGKSAALTTAVTTRLYLSDYGDRCYSGAECLSGICGSSCSSYDFSSAESQSCMCPETREGENVCCGCVIPYDTAVSTCLQPIANWAGVNPGAGVSAEQRQTVPDLPAYSYAFDESLGITEDDLDSNSYTHEVMYEPPLIPGPLAFGAPCDAADDCSSGMCGTGCDCDSWIEADCSCEMPCNFPNKCCGGCIIGTDPDVVTCPAGVTVTTFSGPSVYAGR